FARRAEAWYLSRHCDKAINDLNEAIRLDPKYLIAYIRRGVAWLEKGDYARCIKDWHDAIRLDPQHAGFLYGRIAWLLATCPHEKVRDGKRAIQMATKACELTDWKDGQELEALAAACADAGEFDDAVRYQKRALEDPVCQGRAAD